MKKLAGAVNCRYLLSLLLSILFAFLIGAGILAVSGFHPLEAYGAMLSGAFDSARHIGDFLEYAMVLCVCGLACVLGARVGIFTVGGEGQLLLGAIFAAQVGVWMDGQPRFLVIVCAALAAMAVGGLYAFLPGVLKVKVKVNEVITTIMLNTSPPTSASTSPRVRGRTPIRTWSPRPNSSARNTGSAMSFPAPTSPAPCLPRR